MAILGFASLLEGVVCGLPPLRLSSGLTLAFSRMGVLFLLDIVNRLAAKPGLRTVRKVFGTNIDTTEPRPWLPAAASIGRGFAACRRTGRIIAAWSESAPPRLSYGGGR